MTQEFPDAAQRELLAAGETVVEAGGDVITVVAPDRPGLFSRVAGSLALHGLEVRAADAAGQDGMAIEVFQVVSRLAPSVSGSFGLRAALAELADDVVGERITVIYRSRPAFRIVDSYSRIEEDTESQMTWTVIDTGFQMTLSAEVPATLDRSIVPFASELLARNDLTMEDVKFWAVHPGGRRIVDAVRDRLDLSEEDVAGSYEVLARYGNMSSPTILFVLEAALDRVRDAGELGVALAFGPGLTLESMLLESV